MMAIPAAAALGERPRYSEKTTQHARFIFFWIIVCGLVGFRYEVGGDWSNYLRHFVRTSYSGFGQVVAGQDPGYQLVNWAVAKLGGGIWLVNLICAVVFSYGVSVFSRAQPRPWLAIAVSVPYLVIVVAMGYTRQSVAIGLSMAGLVALGQGNGVLKFVLWVVAASTFHKSAVLLIPLAALAGGRGALWNIAWVGGAAVSAYFVLVADSVDELITNYIDAEYQSGGASIRVAMNALPAGLLVVFRSRLAFRPYERRLWVIMASLALMLIPGLWLSPSSTAIDRVGLYLLPLQMLVLSRFPEALGKTADIIVFLTVGYSFSVLIIWLNFASNAGGWLPYRSYLW